MRGGASALRNAIVVGFMIGSVLVTGGCKISGPKQAGPCDWMKDPAGTDGHTVVMVDVSNSTRSSGGAGSAPDYPTALTTQVRNAVARRDTVSIAPFSGTASDVSWTAGPLSTDWKRNNDNPDLQTTRSDAAGTCLTTNLRQAAATRPAAPGSDPLMALRAAAGLLHANQHGSMHLVLATDGLATTGCADLTRAGFSRQAEIDAIVAHCMSSGDISRDEFAGITVDLVGIGHPAANQPVPTAAQAAWLDHLWQGLCTAAAGTSGTCTIDTISVGSDDSQTDPVPSVADPAVPFTNGDQTVYSVPSAALFDTNRSEVRASAEPLLLEIAVSARTTPYTLVDVRGYADPRGMSGSNRVLSKARADAVMTVLAADGVQHIVAHGLGETTTCPEAYAGTARLQCERRVDIVVTTTQRKKPL